MSDIDNPVFIIYKTDCDNDGDMEKKILAVFAGIEGGKTAYWRVGEYIKTLSFKLYEYDKSVYPQITIEKHFPK